MKLYKEFHPVVQEVNTKALVIHHNKLSYRLVLSIQPHANLTVEIANLFSA
jgi:hypothetical protein